MPWLFYYVWEQRKLNNYLIVSDEKNVENLYKKEDVLSVSGDFGIVNQIEFQGRSFAGVLVSNYGIVYKGDVVYTKSPLKATPYGIIKTNKGKAGIVSVLYGIYHTKENANPDFIQIYFEQNARLNNYLRPLVNKGAKNTLLISDEDALEGIVNFPSSFNEQFKISKVFHNLDNLITLHQRKYFYCHTLIKLPAIAWEQRKLGEESTDIVAGGDINKLLICNKGQYPVIANALNDDGIIGYYANQYRIKAPAVTITGRGEVGFAKARTVNFTPVVRLLSVKSNHDVFYLENAINTLKIMIESTGVPQLTVPQIAKYEIYFPNNLKEEQLIGNLFCKLDYLIALHQRECFL